MTRAPLRIAHVIPQIGIGGAELQLHRLICSTPPERAIHRVLYYSDSRDDAGYRLFDRAGIDCRRIPKRRSDPCAFISALTTALRDGPTDIAHCWLVSASFWGHWAATIARVPRIVLSFRSTQVDLAPLLRLSHWAHTDGVYYLANTGAVAAAVSRRVGVTASRITIIPNGVDAAPAPSTQAHDALLREYDCPPGTRVVTMVGRLTDAKNYPMLLRLAARCRGNLPAHFFIAGHGEMESLLQEQARQMDVADRVHFLGLHHDVAGLLSATDIFCYTSRFEGFPNALLEAMAAGLPIITTAFAGVEDLAQDGITASIVPQGDDEAAFGALQGMLSDPHTARALALAAKQAAEARFSTARMTEDVLSYYETIAATQR